MVDSADTLRLVARQMASPATLLFPPLARPSAGWQERALAAAQIAAFILILAGLVALALYAPDNHDEAQYAATAVLSRDGLPFRDFLSLQPPVHALLYAPLAAWFSGDTFLVMRLATALTAGLLLIAVYGAQRRLGVSALSATIASIALAGCAAFQFAGSVVRNDMLAALFMAAGIAATIPRRSSADASRRWAVAGLLLGLAAATKLSYVPALVAPLFVLRRDAAAWRPYLAGAALGLAPLLALAAVAPAQAWYGLIEFGVHAPFHWYTANGLDDRVGLASKFAGTAQSLARGPALPALAIILVAHRRMRRPRHRMLAAMLIAGLVGALMPTPTHLPYLMPLLPPLFILAGRALDGLRDERRAIAIVGLAMFALIGSSRSTRVLTGRTDADRSAVAVDGQTRWIADRVRAEGISGRIATLSPHRALDTGLAIDPRFATGPFVFRSGALLSPTRAADLNVATPLDLVRQLDASPPAAILAGYERRSRRFTIDPDRQLVAYARTRDYRALPLPDGVGTLYLRRR